MELLWFLVNFWIVSTALSIFALFKAFETLFQKVLINTPWSIQRGNLVHNIIFFHFQRNMCEVFRRSENSSRSIIFVLGDIFGFT